MTIIYIYIYIYIYIDSLRDALSVMIIIVGNDTVTRVQILDEAVCISHSSYTLKKGMHLLILPTFMDK